MSKYTLALSSMIVSDFLLIIILLPVANLIFGFDLFLTLFMFLVSFLINYIHFYIFTLRVRNEDKKILFPSIIPSLTFILLLLFLKPQTISLVVFIALGAWLTAFIFVVLDISVIKGARLLKKDVFEYLNSTKILVLTTLLTQVYGNFDLILIKKVLSPEAAGFYKVALSLSMFVLPTIGIFSFIYLSKIKEYVSMADFRLVKNRRNHQLLLILVLITIYVVLSIILNRYIVDFLYGIDDKETVTTSVILAFSVGFNSLAMVQTYTLIGLNKERKLLKVLSFAAVLNVILNMFFVPKFGIIAGATVNAFTHFAIFVYVSIIVNRIFGAKCRTANRNIF